LEKGDKEPLACPELPRAHPFDRVGFAVDKINWLIETPRTDLLSPVGIEIGKRAKSDDPEKHQ
jgi:hypothetical protein